MRHCPQCGSEFQDWVETCLDCGAALRDGGAAEYPAEDENDEFPREGELNLAEADLEDLVDEIIENEDFVNPDAVDEYGDRIEVTPRANLVSVFQNPAENAVVKAARVLKEAGLKLFLLKKSGVFDYFYVLMVEVDDREKADQILEETAFGNLIPIDPDVEDPELKDAPVINLDEEKERAASARPQPEKESPVVNCPDCGSRDIEIKSSFFSLRAKLKCRVCGAQWKE